MRESGARRRGVRPEPWGLRLVPEGSFSEPENGGCANSLGNSSLCAAVGVVEKRTEIR